MRGLLTPLVSSEDARGTTGPRRPVSVCSVYFWRL